MELHPTFMLFFRKVSFFAMLNDPEVRLKLIGPALRDLINSGVVLCFDDIAEAKGGSSLGEDKATKQFWMSNVIHQALRDCMSSWKEDKWEDDLQHVVNDLSTVESLFEDLTKHKVVSQELITQVRSVRIVVAAGDPPLSVTVSEVNDAIEVLANKKLDQVLQLTTNPFCKELLSKANSVVQQMVKDTLADDRMADAIAFVNDARLPKIEAIEGERHLQQVDLLVSGQLVDIINESLGAVVEAHEMKESEGCLHDSSLKKWSEDIGSLLKLMDMYYNIMVSDSLSSMLLDHDLEQDDFNEASDDPDILKSLEGQGLEDVAQSKFEELLVLLNTSFAHALSGYSTTLQHAFDLIDQET